MLLGLTILMVLMRTPYTIPFILFIYVNCPSSVKWARVSEERRQLLIVPCRVSMSRER